MINKILSKLGYFKKEIKNISVDLTVEELSLMLANKLGTDVVRLPTEEEHRIFKELKGVEGFTEWLKNSARKDIERYFAASDDREREVIRGAFARTNYIYGRVISEGETKLNNKRYG